MAIYKTSNYNDFSSDAYDRVRTRIIDGLDTGSLVVSSFNEKTYIDHVPELYVTLASVGSSRYRHAKRRSMSIEKVIFNDPATIVFWEDDTKTVVKRGENDIFDPEKGLAMAIAKKALGNKGNYYNEIKKWLPEHVEFYADDKVVEKSYMSDLPDKVETLKQSLKKLGDLIAGNGSD